MSEEQKPQATPPTGALPKVRPQSMPTSTHEPVTAVELGGLVSEAAAHQSRAAELAAKQQAFEAEKERQRKLLEQEQRGVVEDDIEAATAPLAAKLLRAEAFRKAQKEVQSANADIAVVNAKRRGIRRTTWLVGAVILVLGMALWVLANTWMGGW